jgi:hypothetical protein
LVEQLVQVHIDSPGDRTDLLGQSRADGQIGRYARNAEGASHGSVEGSSILMRHRVKYRSG